MPLQTSGSLHQADPQQEIPKPERATTPKPGVETRSRRRLSWRTFVGILLLILAGNSMLHANTLAEPDVSHRIGQLVALLLFVPIVLRFGSVGGL